jgi:hypothetical protein
MAEAPNFVLIHIAQGELEANIIKSHLESEGIPVLLKYGGGGTVFGLTVDGWGEIEVLVPQELAEEAKHIIQPQEVGRAEE